MLELPGARPEGWVLGVRAERPGVLVLDVGCWVLVMVSPALSLVQDILRSIIFFLKERAARARGASISKRSVERARAEADGGGQRPTRCARERRAEGSAQRAARARGASKSISKRKTARCAREGVLNFQRARCARKGALNF